jgi:transcriptional regulator with XRE-family HTH domain
MSKFGQNNTRAAKLSNEQVFELRGLYAEGATQAHLARRYGVTTNTVGRIVRGESRQNVPLPEENHTAAQQRLLVLQEQRGDKVLEEIRGKAQKVYDKTIKVDKELERLAETFGVKETS